MDRSGTSRQLLKEFDATLRAELLNDRQQHLFEAADRDAVAKRTTDNELRHALEFFAQLRN